MRNANRPAKYQRHAPLAAGQKFNRMTLIENRSTDDRKYHWLCRCDCGTEKVVNAFDVRRGRVQSCGCALLDKDAYFARRRTASWHGQAICEHCGAAFERRANGQRFCCKAHAAVWVAAHRKPASRTCFTDAEVAEIRAAIEAGPRGIASAMARKHGVSMSVICRIKNGSYGGRKHV